MNENLIRNMTGQDAKRSKKIQCISVWHKTFRLSHQFVQKEVGFPFVMSAALTIKTLAKQSIFCRVTDIPCVLQKTVSSLPENNMYEHLSSCQPGSLRLLLSVDKGGCSTKLMLHILNTSKRHSIQTGRLLAFFCGGADTYSNINSVFGSVIAQLYRTAETITALKLPSPKQKLTLPSQFIQHCSAPKTMKHLAKLDKNDREPSSDERKGSAL